jgi:hypothetical protein
MSSSRIAAAIWASEASVASSAFAGMCLIAGLLGLHPFLDGGGQGAGGSRRSRGSSR